MKYIIAGTNRPSSRSLKLAKLIQGFYLEQGEGVEIIDLGKLPINELQGSLYGKPLPQHLQQEMEKINQSSGLIFIVPEYNGSIPGALKYFIDFWTYPLSFEWRPVCFIGLGGMFGGLRAVEHLQQVFGYRNSFIYPDRVFLTYVWNIMNEQGELSDANLIKLLKTQAKGFSAYVAALESAGLAAKTRPSAQP